ncbi:hypothetical protein ACFP81_15095 [Deinococcus lacus]|uniref:Alpha/beta hydrolase n=1 Tax=Deinococcus lacus TaxID=392561 RepID=A0ABW1YGA1_9DEIO
MGHSLGAQMALALSEQAYADAALPSRQRPGRLILADPYWSPANPLPNHHYRYLAPDTNPAERSARIVRNLQAQGAAIEWVKSSPLLDIGGDNNSALLAIASRSETVPDYLSGLALGDRHNSAPRWYMWSYGFENRSGVSTAASSDDFAATFMLLARASVQQQGTQTATPDDDRFAPK